MASQIYNIVCKILQERGQNNPILIQTTKTKLLLKGLNPDKFTSNSIDDPISLEKVKEIAKELNVTI